MKANKCTDCMTYYPDGVLHRCVEDRTEKETEEYLIKYFKGEVNEL